MLHQFRCDSHTCNAVFFYPYDGLNVPAGLVKYCIRCRGGKAVATGKVADLA